MRSGMRRITTLRKLPTSKPRMPATAIQAHSGSKSRRCGISMMWIFPLYGADARRGESRLAPCGMVLLESVTPLRQTVPASLKIGRYSEMTMPPTMTPRITMINGSSRVLSVSTAFSTSSS